MIINPKIKDQIEAIYRENDNITTTEVIEKTGLPREVVLFYWYEMLQDKKTFTEIEYRLVRGIEDLIYMAKNAKTFRVIEYNQLLKIQEQKISILRKFRSDAQNF